MQSAKCTLTAIGCFHVCFEARLKKLAIQVAFLRCRRGIILGCFTCESGFLYCRQCGKAAPVFESCELKYCDFFMMYISTRLLKI